MNLRTALDDRSIWQQRRGLVTAQRRRSAVGYRKPHLRIFQAALDHLGLSANERVIMVGDQEQADILGAKAMGFTNVKGIPSGITLANSEADCIIKGADLLHRFQTRTIP